MEMNRGTPLGYTAKADCFTHRSVIQTRRVQAYGGVMMKAALSMATIALMTTVSIAGASATTIPDAFHGAWQPTELGKAPACLPQDGDIRQTILADKIDLHEGLCTPKAVSVTGAESLRIDARCHQEDSSWDARQEWLVRTIDGHRYLTIRSLDPKRPYTADLGLCRGQTASADLSRPAAQPGRLPLQDGRYVTDKALCSLSEAQMIERHGDMLGTMVRVIDGENLSDAYEMKCTVRDVRIEGDDIHFRAGCNREGEIATVNGRYARLSPTSFRLGRRTFSLCEAGAPAARQSTVASAATRSSICYRDGMSELKIRPNADGTAHIDIESVQGNAHICSLVGTASRTNVGYEYRSRLDDGRQCLLAIMIDGKGSIAFKDPDWVCKQYHCGARAAFEHIQFGPKTRSPCN